MNSSTDEVGSSDEVRIEMCSSNFLKAQKLVRANQNFDPESVISETYSSDEDSFLELKRENTRLDKSLKEYKFIISEIVGVMNSTGDVECSTRNVANRVKEITFEFIQLSNQHSEINHVGNELNEVSHQRQLEQEEIKALRLELEVIREREKRVKSENKIERMKFAHEIERMKFEIERMKLDQEIYTTRQKKLQAKHHKIMKGTKSNCHTACQTSSIIDGAILKQKDEAIASLRKELEGMRIGNNQRPCGSQLEQENKKLRQLKIELEYGIMAEELDNLTTLTKTDPSGRKMGARELEELITREAFKNKIQKSEKINLKVKTVDELQDLLDKQVGIKKNKLIINLLPDKGAKIISLCKEIEEEIASRTVQGDIVKLLQNLTIVEKRPSAQLLKRIEAEQEIKPPVARFHTHRNPQYETKFMENPIKSLKIDEERKAHNENLVRDKSIENNHELAKMRDGGRMPLILQSSTSWRETNILESSDEESEDSES